MLAIISKYKISGKNKKITFWSTSVIKKIHIKVESGAPEYPLERKVESCPLTSWDWWVKVDPSVGCVQVQFDGTDFRIKYSGSLQADWIP